MEWIDTRPEEEIGYNLSAMPVFKPHDDLGEVAEDVEIINQETEDNGTDNDIFDITSPDLSARQLTDHQKELNRIAALLDLHADLPDDSPVEIFTVAEPCTETCATCKGDQPGRCMCHVISNAIKTGANAHAAVARNLVAICQYIPKHITKVKSSKERMDLFREIQK